MRGRQDRRVARRFTFISRLSVAPIAIVAIILGTSLPFISSIPDVFRDVVQLGSKAPPDTRPRNLDLQNGGAFIVGTTIHILLAKIVLSKSILSNRMIN
ncbi:MAG: hypothetical protein ACRD3Q_19565, partial [Terriglobales bacterium]